MKRMLMILHFCLLWRDNYPLRLNNWRNVLKYNKLAHTITNLSIIYIPAKPSTANSLYSYSNGLDSWLITTMHLYRHIWTARKGVQGVDRIYV